MSSRGLFGAGSRGLVAPLFQLAFGSRGQLAGLGTSYFSCAPEAESARAFWLWSPKAGLGCGNSYLSRHRSQGTPQPCRGKFQAVNTSQSPAPSGQDAWHGWSEGRAHGAASAHPALPSLPGSSSWMGIPSARPGAAVTRLCGVTFVLLSVRASAQGSG